TKRNKFFFFLLLWQYKKSPWAIKEQSFSQKLFFHFPPLEKKKSYMNK
ncbi:Protein HGH1, partial [Daphnia magna]